MGSVVRVSHTAHTSSITALTPFVSATSQERSQSLLHRQWALAPEKNRSSCKYKCLKIGAAGFKKPREERKKQWYHFSGSLGIFSFIKRCHHHWADIWDVSPWLRTTLPFPSSWRCRLWFKRSEIELILHKRVLFKDRLRGGRCTSSLAPRRLPVSRRGASSFICSGDMCGGPPRSPGEVCSIRVSSSEKSMWWSVAPKVDVRRGRQHQKPKSKAVGA